MSEMVKIALDKSGIDRLFFYLDLLEETRIQEKIKRYGHVIYDDNGEVKGISFQLYSSDATDLIYLLLAILPDSKTPQQHFEECAGAIIERERLYQEEKERKERELCDGIRNLLIEDPGMTGADIARRLRVGKSVVYERWNKIKAELNQSAE